MGTAVFQPDGLDLLAQASPQAWELEEGLALLTAVLAMANGSGECRREAERHRLEGELPLHRTAEDDREAETCCRHALDITHG